MSYTAILFEKKDNVAKITINRPEAANALNFDLAYDLMHASLECDEDPEIRAVVMTGSGRMFCAGGDLKSFSAQGEKLPAHRQHRTSGRTWPNQQEITVKGSHFIQEDSPQEIGQAITSFLQSI